MKLACSLASNLRSSQRLAKAGILVSLAALVAWTNEQVGVHVNQIVQWGDGSVSNPYVVSRDNPWFEGTYSAYDGAWGQASGTYSHEFSTSCSGTLHTFEYGGAQTKYYDDWVTPLRPLDGSWYVGGRGNSPAMPWAVRSGNLIPGNLYGVFQTNCAAGSTSTTYFKLDNQIIVVPVLVFSWILDPMYGTEELQDFQTEGRALFDFIPFEGSKTSTAVAGWNPNATDDPVFHYDSPDDIWTQCGIQFQVVRTFKTYPSAPLPDCHTQMTYRVFVHDLWERSPKMLDVLNAEYPNHPQVVTDIQAALIELNPIIADFGYPGCPGFFGKNDGQTVIEIDISNKGVSGVPGNVVAHELAHLLVTSDELAAPSLLCSTETCSGTTLTPAQCQAARNTAIGFASRFRDYNEKIGRLAKENPEIPTYPAPSTGDPMNVMVSQACCSFEGQTSEWQPLAACQAMGGDIKPNESCAECCEISQSPMTTRWLAIGACPGTVVPNLHCQMVCCYKDLVFQKQHYTTCLPGMVVSADLCGD